VAYLLGWREIYPWISLQMVPLLAYWWMRSEPPMNWFVPIFVITTLFTLSAGPAQIWYAWRLAHPTIHRERRWFVTLLISSLVFYTELKNIIARTAHIKEAMRERKWKVTPRSASPARDPGEAALPFDEVDDEQAGAMQAIADPSRESAPSETASAQSPGAEPTTDHSSTQKRDRATPSSTRTEAPPPVQRVLADQLVPRVGAAPGGSIGVRLPRQYRDPTGDTPVTGDRRPGVPVGDLGLEPTTPTV
jgi:hypothetical protein